MQLPVFASKVEENKFRLKIWAQPGAKKNEVSGTYQDCLKLKIKAPAVENRANKELIRFLGKIFDLKPRQIDLISGHASRKKIILITMDQKFHWGKFNSNI